MSGLTDQQIERAAATVLDVVTAMGDITDGDRSLILKRAANLFIERAQGKTMCLRCLMLVPLLTDGPAEHIAGCRLPCLPDFVRREDWRVHRDLDECPICHCEPRMRHVTLILG